MQYLFDPISTASTKQLSRNMKGLKRDSLYLENCFKGEDNVVGTINNVK